MKKSKKILLTTIIILFVFQQINAQCSPPITPIAVSKSMCEGALIPHLVSNSASTYWYKDIDTTELLTVGYGYTPLQEYLNIGINTFYIVAKSGECASEINSVNLTVYKSPTIELPSDFSVCYYDFSDIIITPLSLSPIYNDDNLINWYINNAGVGVLAETNTTFNFRDNITSSGEYQVSAIYLNKITDDYFCPSNFQTINITVSLCFSRDYLLYIIDSATTLISNALELKSSRYYQEGAIAEFQQNIDDASNVYNDSNATQTEINNAATNLINAIELFKSKEISLEILKNTNNIFAYTTQNNLYIHKPNNSRDDALIQLINLQGVQILQTNKKEINISQLPKGYYIIKILSNDIETKQKILIR